MDNDVFYKFINDLFKERIEVMKSKGIEYTKGNKDKLANFKEIAQLLGLTPLQVWSVYFFKHIASILNYVREGKVHSEPIRSRFVDAINYLELGLALIEEVKDYQPEIAKLQTKLIKDICSPKEIFEEET